MIDIDVDVVGLLIHRLLVGLLLGIGTIIWVG